MVSIFSWEEFKESKDLKKTYGTKIQLRLIGIPKLDDANDVGGRIPTNLL